MAKERLFNLPETKGTFILTGNTTGTEKDRFFNQGKSKKGKDYRSVNFGVDYNEKQRVFVELYGQKTDEIYASKRKENKDDKTVVEKFNWDQRYKLGEDWNTIGTITLGLTKNEDGKNEVQRLFPFDANKTIYETMEDDMSVFVRGTIDFSSFTNKKNETSKSVRFIPQQVSLTSEQISFPLQEGKETKHNFTQYIVFKGIEEEKDDKNVKTGRYVVHAIIVKYESIEEYDFIVKDKGLANQMRKGLKPYNGIEVWGNIECTTKVEEVVSDDWGAKNTMDQVSSPYIRELVITGAKGGNIDKETYTEEKIEKAKAAVKQSQKANEDYGSTKEESSGDWGSSGFDDEEEDW